MSIDLPPLIATYVEANSRLDADGMLAAFAPNATVFDERRRHVGRAEIADWIQSATMASRAIFEPDSCREEDELVVVEGPTSGDFAGSPIRFTFRFRLAAEAITALEIA